MFTQNVCEKMEIALPLALTMGILTVSSLFLKNRP